MTTCKAIDSVTRHNSEDGAWTRIRGIAPTRSSKSFRLKNWRRFFAADADVSTPCPHAIPVLDRHRDPAFPAEAAILRGRDEGLRARASTSRISRAWNRPTHRRRREISPLDGCFLFQRSMPASAASLSGELATTISGIRAAGLFERA